MKYAVILVVSLVLVIGPPSTVYGARSYKDNLHYAVHLGDFEKVKQLVAKGADVNAIFQTNTPLVLASMYNFIEIADYLIKHNADVNISNKFKTTPLMVASGKGYFMLSRLLIENGAKLDYQTGHGNTALHKASSRGRKGVVVLLIAKGADLSITNNAGDTPQDVAWPSVEPLFEPSAIAKIKANPDSYFAKYEAEEKANGAVLISALNQVQKGNHVVTKPLIENGKPTGAHVEVNRQYGKVTVQGSHIGMVQKGRPRSGTIAIARPVKDSETMVQLYAARTPANVPGSDYVGTILEIDERDAAPLTGPGTKLIVRKGVEKIQLGGVYLSTKDSKTKAVVTFTENTDKPLIEGKGVKVWPAPPVATAPEAGPEKIPTKKTSTSSKKKSYGPAWLVIGGLEAKDSMGGDVITIGGKRMSLGGWVFENDSPGQNPLVITPLSGHRILYWKGHGAIINLSNGGKVQLPLPQSLDPRSDAERAAYFKEMMK